MLQQKIDSVVATLGELGGAVSEEAWEKIQAARRELADAGDIAGHLESGMGMPSSEQEPCTD